MHEAWNTRDVSDIQKMRDVPDVQKTESMGEINFMILQGRPSLQWLRTVGDQKQVRTKRQQEVKMSQEYQDISYVGREV